MDSSHGGDRRGYQEDKKHSVYRVGGVRRFCAWRDLGADNSSGDVEMNWMHDNFDLLVAAAIAFVVAGCLILVSWAWK